jgi:hypothetical protein
MKNKLLQLLDLLKTGFLYMFKCVLRCIKVIVEETIVLLQKIDILLTKDISNG